MAETQSGRPVRRRTTTAVGPTVEIVLLVLVAVSLGSVLLATVT
uniref:Type II secretion system protein n=1 Tax=Streptomyces sp. NBC_00093 TaxID=2975649 RepID=A0AAU2AGQ0_9ACTN